jgi:hypothetical protein
MHPFRPRFRARLTCRTAFGAVGWLNVDFLAGTGADLGADIPFHVSLRRDEGKVVVNRRRAWAWGREIAWPFDFGAGPVELRVDFSPGRVALWLGGRRLGGFDALPRPDRAGRFGLRRGFAGLGRIGAVRLNGAVAPGSLRLDCPGLPAPAPGLTLSDRLELVWTDPPEGAPAWLTGPGLDPPEPAALIEGPYQDRAGQPRRALAALVPGRIWAGGAGRVAVGFAGGPSLELDRAELSARLAGAGGSGLWARDPVAALQAVEHARHARMLPDLPDPVRANLLAAARQAGLEAWLAEGQALPAAAPPPPPDPVQAWMDALRRTTGAALRSGQPEAALALARAAMADPDRPHGDRQTMLRGLAEGFIHAGLMDALAALAREAGLLPLDEGGSAWHLSTALPFDVAQGWFGAVADRLAALAARPPGWTVTPAVGWAVARLAALAPDPSGRTPPAAEHRRAVAAFADWLETMAGDYESRAPCLALIGAGVAILARPDRLPDDLAARLARVALRVWGLSPAFWEALGADVPRHLGPGAAVAAVILAEAVAPEPDRARLDAALTQAQVLGIAEAWRFRRELLGPSGLPDGRPDPAALAARWVDPGEACLRALQHPVPAEAPPLAVAAAADHLRRAWPQLHEPPGAAIERALVADARALLADPDPAALADWAARARLTEPGRATGLALALGLAAGLARQGRSALAEALLAPWLAAPPVPLPEPAALAAAVLARHAPALAARLGAPPAAAALDPRGMGPDTLFDTLVCVYSCAPHLDTRLPHLRATWLADLDAAGIPWLVFTGGGDGTAEGRVVRLQAPDDYEGLPDKTLAMVRWVLANTGASRLLKVDDDCFVHVAAMFGDAAPLVHPYLGRPLSRLPGQTDRAWHMAKSASARGQLTPDKSPEPSRYADGGTGYVLSRGAMAALIAAADSPEGRRLRQVSVMEDKLVGDLLAMSGVPLSGEGWRCAVWRRPAPGLPPAPAWEVGPMPFAGAPVRLAHLDDAGAMAAAAEAARAPAPSRGRIWPTFLPARCGSRTNALDLVSPPERLAAAVAAPVAVIAAVRNEAAILPLFLDHYRRLGVGAFLIADNASTDGTGAILRDAPDVAAFSVETPYADSLFGVAWQQAMVANFRVGRWSLVADADEFLVLPDDAPDLATLLAAPAMAGFDAVRIRMLDLYPRGPLSGVTLASGDPFAETGWADRDPFLRDTPVRGPFSDGETLTSALRHRLIPGQRSELFTAQKVALLRYRPWMRLTAGLHHVGEVRLAPRDLTFAHFKYTAAFRAKAEAEVRRRQHFNDAEEYRAYLALMSEGRETIWDEAVSVPWRAALEE